MCHEHVQQMRGDLTIPKPEHPRPDWFREDWLNLNGEWSFQLEEADSLQEERIHNQIRVSGYNERIIVPFSWASPLSGIGRNVKGTGWYSREVNWSPSKPNQRIFLCFGAVDYDCEVWINGIAVGQHQGGYSPFECEVTTAWKSQDNVIVVKAEDLDRDNQTRGKQGYGEIRGIWQTVWLEARPEAYISSAFFKTRVSGEVELIAQISSSKPWKATLSLQFPDGNVHDKVQIQLKKGEQSIHMPFVVQDAKLWSPDQPYLYEGQLQLLSSVDQDSVSTYFGIREIGTVKYGERDYRWITLNGKPIYLNGALDQSFNKEGYFTYPSDEAMREEIYLMKRLGLNMVRIHIKPEEPRKLYWADKLGILVMEDMPCFWGEPEPRAQSGYEIEASEILLRDRNHPSIFSWVMFNETWGLKTNSSLSSVTGTPDIAKSYLPKTREWVSQMYKMAKAMDPTRLVEDNSPCNGDHIVTDINTWHFYVNGYEEVCAHLSEVVDKTFVGSSYNYIGHNKQTDAPLLNSECGNVWGVEGGGAGDSDIAWHYFYMMNEFRRHDKLCGFVFTEFRDVVNEFNGYYRLDGTEKHFGYEDFVAGMTIADLHAPDFVVVDGPPCRTVSCSATQQVKLLGSSYDDQYHGQQLTLDWTLSYDQFGVRQKSESGTIEVQWQDYGVFPLAVLEVNMPNEDALAILSLRLLDDKGEVVSRNFTTFDVQSGKSDGCYALDGSYFSIPVEKVREHSFEYQWDAIQKQKVCGAREGSFVYDIVLPETEEHGPIYSLDLWFEASSSQLLARHREGAKRREILIDLMYGDSAEVEYNANTYYMTDEDKKPSHIQVWIDEEWVGSFALDDHPADSRGVLSWHYQPSTKQLDEAGSYGTLCHLSLPGRVAARLDQKRRCKLRIQGDEGGVSLYGRNAGRYPIDIVIRYRSL
ncbi:glycoside hydrolase family 2 protein [Paenibacillus sp. 1001270B_150601_E10]|uniref:glycoside hydrolase family 2 protein n=1 Tax=Paenibacillus sp. 1001270B_150601_E10 TaxID=2787079 RepID=UPI00189F1266|nr:glycoside hydrolase family 2 TIM barrel-domain containing protein [Paenibacillus sp. 1001270B_150601_E10]